VKGVFNMGLANKITIFRLVLTIVYLVLLYKLTTSLILEKKIYLWVFAFLLYIVIAILDIVDGYIARLYDDVSSFGRMLDPFVDKIFIISSYIIFAGFEATNSILPMWIVLVILFREFLIQGLRHYAEGIGIEFGANIFGKQKMLFQSLVLGGLFLYVMLFHKYWLFKVFLKSLVWFMFIITVVSGMIYTFDFIKKRVVKISF
jgi:CDP-diacylglycerol---glycerol-3-phosphate 3-phosphatidyltransferase